MVSYVNYLQFIRGRGLKVKNLILLAFSLIFVVWGAAGCTTKSKQVDSKISIEQNKKEDYEQNLAYLMKDVSEESKVVSDILTGQKSVEEEKKKEFDLASKDLLETSEKVKKLKHDEKYKDVQFTMDTAMGLLDMSLKLIGDGLELKDRKLIELGNDAVVKASKKINEANEMMKDIE
jgi:hypothetical protein